MIRFDSSSAAVLVLSTATAKEPAVQQAKSLQNALAEDLAAVPQVHHVVMEQVNDALLVWLAVDDPKREVRDRIFQKELDLIDAFPEIKFDFNLVPAMGREISEIATGARPIYSRES
jgi:hypothetical protein